MTALATVAAVLAGRPILMRDMLAADELLLTAAIATAGRAPVCLTRLGSLVGTGVLRDSSESIVSGV